MSSPENRTSGSLSCAPKFSRRTERTEQSAMAEPELDAFGL